MPGRVCVAVSVRTELAQALLKEAGFQVALLTWIPSRGRDKLVEGLDGADAFMIGGSETIDREIMASCTKLQAIVKGGIGIEQIDLDAATELGILVCNSPTPESVIGLAEATAGLIVALFKRLKLNEALLRSGQWKTLDSQGEVMAGKTIGLIGFGRIGRETAKRLGTWGVRLLASSPRATREEAEVLGVTLVSLDELLRESDLVTIHVVLTPETRHMITLGELRLMKPTAYLVNTSRGGVIRETDLVSALNEGLIAGAALDVFEEEPLPPTSPLRRVDPARLILTPHVIGNNQRSLESGQRMAVESIVSVLQGQAPATVVNREAIPRWRARFRA